ANSDRPVAKRTGAQAASQGGAAGALFPDQYSHHRRFPQKRWMRRQASSSAVVEVAYEMRKAGPRPNAVPCTTATPSASRSSVAKSSSPASFLPVEALRPIAPAHDG